MRPGKVYRALPKDGTPIFYSDLVRRVLRKHRYPHRDEHLVGEALRKLYDDGRIALVPGKGWRRG